MGVEKIKRKVLTPGIKGTSGSTYAGAVTVAGNVTYSADVTVPAETLTGSSVAQTVSDHGVSFLVYGTSGKPNDFLLPNPPRAGAVKEIYMTNNTTSIELNINTLTTATVFYATTFNTINTAAASTGSPGGTPAGTAYLKLIGFSTSQWAIASGSTFNWDFVASTGSTATA